MSASTVPLSVSTAVTAPLSSRNPVTVTPNANVAPRSCAPFASERAASPGFTVASAGVTVAPTRSSTWAIGHHSFTCAGSSTRHSTPNSRCMSAPVSSSCIRPGVRATVSDPTRRKPVSTPVSLGSAAYVCALMRESSVSACVPRTWETSPAACQVVPAVSRTRSRTSTSVTPSFVRWYAIDEPMIPPPTITTCARAGGSGDRFEDRAVDVAVRQVFRDGHGPEG